LGTRFIRAPLLSPDGQKLAMLVTDPATGTRIWVRVLGAEEARALPGSEGARLAMWSPDSDELIFSSPGGLRRARLDGSGAQLVAPLSISAGVWTPDDQLIVVSGAIAALPATGGAARTILQGSEYGDIDFVPSGRHLLFQQFGGETGIHALDLSSGSRRLLVPGAYGPARYVAPNMFLYVEDRVLLVRRFDPRDMSLVGDPFPVAQDVGSEAFSVTSGGALSFIRGAYYTRKLAWLDRRGHVVAEVDPSGEYGEVGLPRWQVDGVYPFRSPHGERRPVGAGSGSRLAAQSVHIRPRYAPRRSLFAGRQRGRLGGARGKAVELDAASNRRLGASHLSANLGSGRRPE
jgi:hypothetical protein